MIFLHAMTSHERDRAKRLLRKSRGRAPVLVHPFNFGLTEAERAETMEIAQTLTRAAGGEPRGDEVVRQTQDDYLQRLASYLKTCMSPVGFLFEAVELAFTGQAADSTRLRQHVVRLNTFDRKALQGKADRLWVVIPTRWGGADPCLSSWEDTLRGMAGLGLKQVEVGGCYLLTCQGAEVDPQVAYACLNHLLLNMRRSELFKGGVQVVEATYIHDVEP